MTDTKDKGGFDSEKMRTQFDRFVRSTVDGLEELKDALVKASQTAKVRLDATFLRRERDRLFQQLGEEVYRLIEEGGMKTPSAIRDTVDRIHAIVEQLAQEEEALRAQEEAEEARAEEAEAVDDEEDDEEDEDEGLDEEEEEEAEAPPPPPKKKARKAAKKAKKAAAEDDEDA